MPARQVQLPSSSFTLTLLPLQVDLYESGTIAIVEAVSPELGNRVQRVRVQLPGTSQELLTKFREKKVDFAAHTATEDGGAVFLNLLGMVAKVMEAITVFVSRSKQVPLDWRCVYAPCVTGCVKQNIGLCVSSGSSSSCAIGADKVSHLCSL